MIKGILFDLDGTLIDSMDFWKDIGSLFLIAQGKEPDKDLYTQIKNMSFRQSAEYFISEYQLEMRVDEINKHIYEMVRDAYENKIGLKPYVKDTIQHLKSKGIKIGIVTAIDLSLAKEVLKRNHILDEFEFVFSSEEVGLSKDDSQIYIEAIRSLGLFIEETLLVEDSLYCIKAAKRAGIKTVAIWDEDSKLEEEELKETSDYYIRNLKELEGLL